MVSLLLLLRRRYLLVRITAALAVTAVLWGWALAQWPYIIYPDLTFAQAAAPSATLAFVLLTAIPGLLLLIPSLIFLFAVFKAPLTSDKA